MSDLLSQYAGEVETFRHILDLPDPGKLVCLGPLPLCCPWMMRKAKDAFEKFEQDFMASNLPDGKYIKAPASTAN